ncbi:hypothetical protein BGP_3250 [Beggiatoa sp. PS]|nr:hypothetical protein BGP_3250 [Beggiatoa sp. PS]
MKKFYGYTKHKVSQYAETKYFTIGFKEKEIDLPKGFRRWQRIGKSTGLSLDTSLFYTIEEIAVLIEELMEREYPLFV